MSSSRVVLAHSFLDHIPIKHSSKLNYWLSTQHSQLLTKSEARTIHTESNHSLRRTQIHGRKSELRHTALHS